MSNRQLPKWARDSGIVNRSGSPLIIVDRDAAYTSLLAGLASALERDRDAKAQALEGMPEEEITTVDSLDLAALDRDAVGARAAADGAPTRYWAEVVYQCMKMEMQIAMGTFAFEIRMKLDSGAKERWGHRNLLNADGEPLVGRLEDDEEITRATKGKEAREHFRRLRGFVPS